MTCSVSDYLKTDDNGNSYTWSFRAFKDWKKEFLKRYEIVNGVSFKQDYPISGDREAIYKRVFEMEGIDVFSNNNINRTSHRRIDQTIITTCQKIGNIF